MRFKEEAQKKWGDNSDNNNNDDNQVKNSFDHEYWEVWETIKKINNIVRNINLNAKSCCSEQSIDSKGLNNVTLSDGVYVCFFA